MRALVNLHVIFFPHAILYAILNIFIIIHCLNGSNYCKYPNGEQVL